MREFLDECLTVMGKGAGKHFCNACHEKLCLWRNIVRNWLWSNKHKSSKERLTLKEARERDIAKCLTVHDDVSHPVGDTLPMEQRVYRLKVLTTFLCVAVLLSKLDAFRDLRGEYVSLDGQTPHE